MTSRAPSEVVQGHRKRATFVWVLFILLIMSYTVWLFVDVAEKMKNPSISISIKVSARDLARDVLISGFHLCRFLTLYLLRGVTMTKI